LIKIANGKGVPEFAVHHLALAGGTSTSKLEKPNRPKGHHRALAGGSSISKLESQTDPTDTTGL